jgi:hypothetical protein
MSLECLCDGQGERCARQAQERRGGILGGVAHDFALWPEVDGDHGGKGCEGSLGDGCDSTRHVD